MTKVGFQRSVLGPVLYDAFIIWMPKWSVLQMTQKWEGVKILKRIGVEWKRTLELG